MCRALRTNGPNQTGKIHKICTLKATWIKERKSFLFLTTLVGIMLFFFSSFQGNQLLNHPELQVVLSAHSPSQACSNWRGKMQFITVTSGNKYPVSHKNITDMTEKLVQLPSPSCRWQQFLYRILQAVTNTSAKIIYTGVSHIILIFHLQKGCVYGKPPWSSLDTQVLSSQDLHSQNLNSYFRNSSYCCCLHVTIF